MSAPILTAEMALDILVANKVWLAHNALHALADGETICVDADEYRRLRESHAELLELVRDSAAYRRYTDKDAGEELAAIATAEAIIKELK